MLSCFSCVQVCHPMDCSPPGSFVHGILQARILEWVAISSSRGSSQPKDRTWVSYIAGEFFTHWGGSPFFFFFCFIFILIPRTIVLLTWSETGSCGFMEGRTSGFCKMQTDRGNGYLITPEWGNPSCILSWHFEFWNSYSSWALVSSCCSDG